MTAFLRGITSVILIFATMFANIQGIFKESTEIVDINGSYVVTDELGRKVVSAGTGEKQVGIFYFLWLGQHWPQGAYNNTEIVENHPEAVLSEENWLLAGGGNLEDFHFWGEPLFGYYHQDDEWVLNKHAQMLTDAGIDFMVFDVTNTHIYEEAFLKLLSVWYKYYLDGWNVPKLAFYTNTKSGETMNKLYDTYYNNPALKEQYPRLDELWYRIDESENAKPMIVGDISDTVLREDVRSYFRIKANQWPTDKKKKDAFPWIEFGNKLTLNAIHKNSFYDKSIISVSVAQHAITGCFSESAWYGAKDYGRSWKGNRQIKTENAVLYGYNIQEQWDFVYGFDPDIVFVTSWNEWVAQRFTGSNDKPIMFVDQVNTEYSRDIEPHAGILGDNYYMQLVKEIARYKGKTARVENKAYISLNIDADFSQWQNGDITAVYKDYENDTINRDCEGFGDLYYTDTTGRNDIVNMKVAESNESLYFYVETSKPLTSSTDENWMNLLINTEPSKGGYTYYINRTSPENGKASIETYNDKDGFTKIGEAEIRFEGKELMLEVSKSDLDLKFGEKANFSFKWCDNCDVMNVYSFYKNGDSAPYGRLNYNY